MPAPDRIKQLIETFEQNIHEYRSNKNETELRREFLDKFFTALGWDVAADRVVGRAASATRPSGAMPRSVSRRPQASTMSCSLAPGGAMRARSSRVLRPGSIRAKVLSLTR